MSPTLRENIRRIRDAAGLTAKEASERAGMHQVTWSDIERGKNPNPTPSTLEKIANSLGVTLAELFVDEDGESVMLEEEQDPARRIDDWVAWFHHAAKDVTGLLVSRLVYRELGVMVASNTQLQQPNHFYEFLARAYADHIAAGIRRQLDLDKRTHSLRRLLREIGKKPEILSRQRYVDLVVGSSKQHPELQERKRQLANKEFDDRHGAGSKHFDAKQATEDEQRLLDWSAAVVRHVNSHVAHLNAEPEDDRPATFDELNDSLDSLHGLVKKYRFELEAVTLMDPVLAGGWLEIFRVPWLSD